MAGDLAEPFRGADYARWRSLPRGLGHGAWCQLGVDAAIGVRSWDVQARVVLRIGPLDRAAFAALLPDRPGYAKLVALVRAFVGSDVDFAVNPVLAANAVPDSRLCDTDDAAPRLGCNAWLQAAGPRVAAAADAVFAA